MDARAASLQRLDAGLVVPRADPEVALKFGKAVEYMLPIEKERLNSLSDPVTIYRGQIAGRRAGISWTTDRERAEWFAKRLLYGGEPAVITGRVKRADIIAVFEERNES